MVVHDGQVAVEVRHGKAVDHRERHPGRAREPGRGLRGLPSPQPHTGRRQPPAPLTGTPTAQTINLCGTARSIGTFPAHGPHGPTTSPKPALETYRSLIRELSPSSPQLTDRHRLL